MKYCIECGAKLTEKECINFGLSEGMIPYCPICNEFRFPVYNTAVSKIGRASCRERVYENV